MQVVEQHVISKRDARYVAIDEAAFASKNLYNQVTFQFRQALIHEGKYPTRKFPIGAVASKSK